MVSALEGLFPKLGGDTYQVTSPKHKRYNCIAWAMGDTLHWWWPELDVEDGYWPPGVPAEVTLDAFLAAFATLGYVPCAGEAVEPGFTKLALFATPEGIPTHAARQLPSGRWTSKLGKLEDIEHALHDLAGTEYGSVVHFLKRPLPPAVGDQSEPQSTSPP